MNIIKMRKYSGQAIAIIMIILVVATVIGASLYSRIIKNRDALIETKESTRALEQADTLLDTVITGNMATVQDRIKACLAAGVCEATTLDDLKVLLGLDTNLLDTVSDWCEGSAEEQDSSMQVTFAYADASDTIDQTEGSVMSINLAGLVFTAGCDVTLSFTGQESFDELFTIKKVYMDAGGNVKPYVLEDMLLYCISDDANCDSTNMAPYTSLAGTLYPGANTLSFDLSEISGTYALYELRLLFLDGDISVGVGYPECAGEMRNYKVNAEVTCNGDTREKMVILPNIHHLGYPMIFDYTLYNGSGVLRPS